MKFSKFNALIFMMLIMVGCMARTPATKDIASTSDPESLHENTLTKIPQTLSPLDLSSPTPPITLTPPPTLSVKEREIKIKELLETNGNCELPCWWGIKPGLDTWVSVNELLLYMGAKTGVFEENGNVVHEVAGLNFDQEFISTRVYLIEENDVISAIMVHSSGRSEPSNFKNIWTDYSPENILLKYGIPSRVWLYSNSIVNEGTTSYLPYSIWIFYDVRGILFRYIGLVDYQAIYKMCPLFGEEGDLVNEIDIYLQSPDSLHQIELLTDMKYYGGEPISIEKAAGITPSEFYNMFTNPEKQTCLETPRDIWR